MKRRRDAGKSKPEKSAPDSKRTFKRKKKTEDTPKCTLIETSDTDVLPVDDHVDVQPSVSTSTTTHRNTTQHHRLQEHSHTDKSRTFLSSHTNLRKNANVNADVNAKKRFDSFHKWVIVPPTDNVSSNANVRTPVKDNISSNANVRTPIKLKI